LTITGGSAGAAPATAVSCAAALLSVTAVVGVLAPLGGLAPSETTPVPCWGFELSLRGLGEADPFVWAVVFSGLTAAERVAGGPAATRSLKDLEEEEDEGFFVTVEDSCILEP